MVNGFQMYLDEHDGKLGGAKVTFIIEDDQGKPDVDIAKAKKLILQDKVDMLVGAVLASSAYALAPVSPQKRRSISARFLPPTISPSARSTNILTLSFPLGCHRSRIFRSANGPATRATSALWPAQPTMPSATSSSAASKRLRGLRRQDHPEGLGTVRQ